MKFLIGQINFLRIIVFEKKPCTLASQLPVGFGGQLPSRQAFDTQGACQ